MIYTQYIPVYEYIVLNYYVIHINISMYTDSHLQTRSTYAIWMYQGAAARAPWLPALLSDRGAHTSGSDIPGLGWLGWLIVTSMEMIWHVFLWLVDGWWYEINLYNDHYMIINWSLYLYTYMYIYIYISVKHVFFSKTSWDLDLGPCSQTQRQGTVRSRSLVSQLIVWCKKRTVYGGMIEKKSIIYYRSLTIIDNYRCK